MARNYLIKLTPLAAQYLGDRNHKRLRNQQAIIEMRRIVEAVFIQDERLRQGADF
jgi:hypothetical protein